MSSHLQQMIERSAAELLQQGGNKRAGVLDGVLFLGNPQLVFPRMLYEDPILEPLERNVWAVIKLHATDNNSVTAFPTYEELMLRCQVGSKATISRALAILRATRWLTVCKSRLRDSKGRVRGNIYALHDEPLQLAETLELDGDYLAWLESTASGQGNPHPRAKGLATKLLRDMQNDIKAGIDISQLEPPMERRSRVLRFLSQQGGNFYGASSQTVHEMRTGDYVRQPMQEETAQVQELYPGTRPRPPYPSTETVRGATTPLSTETVPGGSTVSVPRSNSSSNKIKETTTTVTSTDFCVSPEPVRAELAFPAQLDKSTLVLVRLQVEALPANLRQTVLDVLGAKLAAIAQGISKPLTYGVFPYTRRLCELAIAGNLQPVRQPISTSADPASDPATELKLLLTEMSVLAGDIRHAEIMAQSTGYKDPSLAGTRKKYLALKKRADELRAKDAMTDSVSAGNTFAATTTGVSAGNSPSLYNNMSQGVSAGNTLEYPNQAPRSVSGGNTSTAFPRQRPKVFPPETPIGNDPSTINSWSNKT